MDNVDARKLVRAMSQELDGHIGRSNSFPTVRPFQTIAAVNSLRRFSLEVVSSLGKLGEVQKAARPHSVKFDDVLREVGDFGRYQKQLLLLVCLTTGCVSFQSYSPVFTMKIPRHRCKLPGYPNDTYEIQSPYHELLVNRTIPRRDGEYAECHMYDLNGPDWGLGHNRTETRCSEWVYDTSEFTSTIVSDLDLVCSQTIYRSHSSMMVFAGKFLGAMLHAVGGDYFGRQRVYTVMMLGMAASSVGIIFVCNIPMLMIFRFLGGATTLGASLSCVVISTELLGTSKRRWSGVASRISSVAVKLIMTLLAFLLRDWQHFQAALAVPVIFVLIGYFFIPESPRWLVSKGRYQEAQKVLDQIAKTNKKVPKERFEEEAMHNIQDDVAKITRTKSQASPLSLFRIPRLLKRYTLLYIAWILTATCTFGLALNVSTMSGDIFINFLLLTVADVVALFLYALLVERVGRRPLIIGVSLFGGVTCLATVLPVMLGGSDWILRILTNGGRIYASTATPALHTLSFELFPTVLASFGIGSCSMLSRIGGLASPYVADLNLFVKEDWGPAVPQVVFGICGIVTGAVIFLVPETKGRLLPETVEDAEKFGRSIKEKKEKTAQEPSIATIESGRTSDTCQENGK